MVSKIIIGTGITYSFDVGKADANPFVDQATIVGYAPDLRSLKFRKQLGEVSSLSNIIFCSSPSCILLDNPLLPALCPMIVGNRVSLPFGDCRP